MASQALFTFNYKQCLIDEIALEGLEGSGLDLLWRRLEKRISSEVTLKMKIRFWNYIVTTESISMYELKKPVPRIELLDRFSIIDENTGNLLDPPDYLDGPYEYQCIEKEYGSCINFDTRKLLKKDSLQKSDYQEIVSKYGEKLVLVACLEERWKALAPHLPILYLNQLTPVHFCLLELIGRSRHNGQMTVGKTNLSKVVKDAKLLFYNRTVLQKLDLIKVQYSTQVVAGRALKSILLRLNRFYEPTLCTQPKIGKLYNIIQHLQELPDYSEQTDVMIKKGLLTPPQSKRLQKTINIFNFEERDITINHGENSKIESSKQTVKRKYISLNCQSDESQTDDENSEDDRNLKCQYKVGVNLGRQAYECFLEAGLKGLTQIDIAQLLGIEFYTSRTICRIFKARKIVREFLEDKGRQRTARYIAIAATKDIDKQYAKEKSTFMEHCNKRSKDKKLSKDLSSDSESDVPLKKIKKSKEDNDTKTVNEKQAITEVKIMDGCENVTESLSNQKKNPTLRQLKFANGIIKVVQDRKYIMGFQVLSNLVAKETGEPPMDTKALKIFTQKLVADGQLKILKIKRPSVNGLTCNIFICAPHIKASDPIIRAKYKEICARSEVSKKAKLHKSTPRNIRPLTHFTYPRYMKIQRLHEFLTQLIYFNENSCKDNMNGISSLMSIIPEMTVELALGHISHMDETDMNYIKTTSFSLDDKVKDAPIRLNRIILQSRSLINSLKVVLKVLALLGLIQLVHQTTVPINRDAMDVFFVNRHAKIINTMGKWPQPNIDKSVLEKSYDFKTFENVKEYWGEVHEISINTTINVPRRQQYKLCIPVRNEHNLTNYDTGEIFGDGLGPCGFDSSIYMDIPRLWRSFMIRNHTKTNLRKPKVKRVKKKPSAQVETKPKIKSIKNETTIKIKDFANIRKRQLDSNIKWSNFEDRILMMCKAAITIMSPVSQPGCLRVRNIVAKDLLSIFDPRKTAAICHKRAILLESNSTLAHEKDCILNELRCHRNLIQKYEGLLRVLRLRNYANLSKYINESRIPLLQLIWILAQIAETKPFNKRMPCVAIDLKDFNKKYIISPSSANRAYNLYRTPTTAKPEFATLKEAIIMTIMLSLEEPVNKKMGKKIFSIFNIYDEPTLRNAIQELRKCGAIAARDKMINSQIKKEHCEDIVQTMYKIAMMYRRKWISRLEPEFLDSLSELLSTKIPHNGLKGSCDINCLLCETYSHDVIDIVSDTIPVVTGSAGSILQEEQLNVIDIETKFKLKSGLLGWKNKSTVETFSELYHNIAYDGIFENLIRKSIVDYSKTEEDDVKDDIVQFLEDKESKGCTFRELNDKIPVDQNTLIQRLLHLESKGNIKMVGLYENVIVLKKYAKPYLLFIPKNLYMIPAPWLTLKAEIQKDVFFKWSGVIMNKVFECPGCSIAFISNSIEYITYRSVQDVCMFLEQTKCVELIGIEKQETDLFSEEDYNWVPELYGFNPYDSPDNILVVPVKDCLSKYAYIRSKILNDIELS